MLMPTVGRGPKTARQLARVCTGTNSPGAATLLCLRFFWAEPGHLAFPLPGTDPRRSKIGGVGTPHHSSKDFGSSSAKMLALFRRPSRRLQPTEAR